MCRHDILSGKQCRYRDLTSRGITCQSAGLKADMLPVGRLGQAKKIIRRLTKVEKTTKKKEDSARIIRPRALGAFFEPEGFFF